MWFRTMTMIMFETEKQEKDFCKSIGVSDTSELFDLGAVVAVDKEMHDIVLWLYNNRFAPWIETLACNDDEGVLKELRNDGHMLQRIIDIVFVKGSMTQKEEDSKKCPDCNTQWKTCECGYGPFGPPK